MNGSASEDAELTAGRLPADVAQWSREVHAPDGAGVTRRWHLLDNGAEAGAGTLLCVHGNPTWSYLWRRFLATAPPGWRVVAVDQLGMGLSDRPQDPAQRPRRFAERVADLGALTHALGVTGPTVVLAHDWGGPIALGWALAHRDQLAGLVLGNTGVDLPGGRLPRVLRLARNPALRDLVCVRTPAFVRAATAVSRPALPSAARRGLAAPYGSPDRRVAVGDFVADIPVEPDHPSRAPLAEVAARLPELAAVPALLLWGPRDPVFGEGFLADLRRRLPQAAVQRYPRASHLVTEDAPEAAEDVWRWVQDLSAGAASSAVDDRPLDRVPWAGLLERTDDPAAAVVELGGQEPRRTSFADLNRRIRDLAAGLAARGVGPGDRVGLLVPPGVDLTVAVYACWRVGATIVVADAGLGLGGLAGALRSAAPAYVFGVTKALVIIAPLRVPGRRVPAERVSDRVRRALTWGVGLPELEEQGRGLDLPKPPGADREAAVLFTSGATGPAKGVVYRLSQLRAQLDAFAAAFALTPADRIVAAFAPFALYGAALGVPAAVPDMSVTKPGTLTAAALAEAVAAAGDDLAAGAGGVVVFASPAALRNVVATAGELDERQRAAFRRVRLVLSFGAPVPVGLLRQVRELTPSADLRTPYGMTEVLPVADISLAEIEAVGPGNGVCVGRPVPGVRLAVSPMDELGRPDGPLTTEPGVTGEVCVAAAHVKDRYDKLWAVERRSSRDPGWHRSGDVGHLDAEGRLWVEGRLVHVVVTADGPVTPVGIEQRVETLPEVRAAAVAGVGPVGTQQVVLVVVPTDGPARPGLAPAPLAAAVRRVAGAPVAAVLVATRLPVDVRHNAKVDRARVGAWAGRLLAGQRAGRLA